MRTKNKNIKESLDQFISKNCDESNAIKKMEKFCKRYLILSSNSFEDYINGKQIKVRIFLEIFARIVLALFVLKILLNAMSKKKIIKIITSDQSHLMGDRRLISTMMSICAGTVLLLALYLLYKEHNHSFDILNLMNALKNKSLAIKISDSSKSCDKTKPN